MRVGLLIYGRLDQKSGGYLYDRKLVEHLRKRGHQVQVISIPWRGYWRSLLDIFSGALLGRLRAAKVDLLIQDELNHPSLFLLNARLKLIVSYPIISIVHLLRYTEPRSRLANWFYRAVESRYLNSVDAFIYNSRDTQQQVEKLTSARKPSVLATPGGDRLRPRITPAFVRTRSRREGPLQVLFLGNLVWRKAPHVLLQAAARLAGKAHWHFAGRADMEPAYVRSLRGQARSLDVIFHGHLDGPRLAKLMRTCQVMALPSAYEGFGIAYLEAMAFGLPVIGTRAGAAPELISHGKTGFLIAPGDSAALAERLAVLHTDRARLTRLSLAALKAYKTFPTWQQSLRKIENFLSSYNQ